MAFEIWLDFTNLHGRGACRLRRELTQTREMETFSAKTEKNGNRWVVSVTQKRANDGAFSAQKIVGAIVEKPMNTVQKSNFSTFSTGLSTGGRVANNRNVVYITFYDTVRQNPHFFPLRDFNKN